jgi:hypothetical protein
VKIILFVCATKIKISVTNTASVFARIKERAANVKASAIKSIVLVKR